MNYFWLEYFHFDAVMLGILVTISAGSLFFLTLRYERKLRTIWRTVGFFGLALAFFLLILERKFPSLGLPALLIQLLGFFSIWRGVRAEPKLSLLARVGEPTSTEEKSLSRQKIVDRALVMQLAVFVVLIPLVSYLFYALTPVGEWIFSLLELASLVFILLTIQIQVRRYQTESKDPATKRQNLWPLLGYVALAIRSLSLIFFHLPALSNVFLRKMTLNFSAAWILGVIGMIIGFIFLAIWAWNFIKLRQFLRTYVVFLVVAIFVSSLGSAVFTQLIFTIVEKNNLTLMEQGAQTQQLLQEDRAGSGAFFAQAIANNKDFIVRIRNRNKTEITESLSQFLNSSNANIMRAYDKDGVVISSPTDPRDEGKSLAADPYVALALKGSTLVKTFDTLPGVLSPVIVARAIHPVLENNASIGAIEVGYKFDTAFVDYAQENTNLDVTVYAGDLTSATTIRTDDEVNRWVGSREPNRMVVEKTLKNGEITSLALDRLGRPYYSAFTPISNVNGDIIGMVSVGTPTYYLFEDSRQTLITTFLIATVISLLAALIGYFGMRSYRAVVSKQEGSSSK